MQVMTSVVLDPVTVGQMIMTFVPSNAGSVYPDTITSEERFKSGSSHLTVVNKLNSFDGNTCSHSVIYQWFSDKLTVMNDFCCLATKCCHGNIVKHVVKHCQSYLIIISRHRWWSGKYCDIVHYIFSGPVQLQKK